MTPTIFIDAGFDQRVPFVNVTVLRAPVNPDTRVVALPDDLDHDLLLHDVGMCLSGRVADTTKKSNSTTPSGTSVLL